MLSALCAAFTPTSTGSQDLAALFPRHAGASAHTHGHLIASPFGTIHAATFSFSRPIGTALPEPMGLQPVNFDPRSFDVKAWSGEEPPMAGQVLHIEYPTVNRRLKGDRIPLPHSAPDATEPESLPRVQPTGAPSVPASERPPPFMRSRPKSAEQFDSSLSPDNVPNAAFGTLPLDRKRADPMAAIEETLGGADEDAGRVANRAAETYAGEDNAAEISESPFASFSFFDEDSIERDAQLYFGVAVMGDGEGLQEWQPGAVPVPVLPAANPDLKLSALERAGESGPGGETVAGKGNSSLFKSPAERLGLDGKARAKAEKCIADAVYFEARGEPLRGQMAVAQVVMNRVFSGRYPNDVCGVVYQNAHRHLACQFTFACEGKNLSRIDEPDMWEQAKRIAKDTLDGKIWLPEVGHATHYHAYWVHPSWVHEMAKLYKLGVHTFYRPRAWGDGSDAPVWSNVPVAPDPAGAPAQNSGESKDPVFAPGRQQPTARIPQATASPDAASGTNPRTAKL